jgi:WD40 repeat protein
VWDSINKVTLAATETRKYVTDVKWLKKHEVIFCGTDIESVMKWNTKTNTTSKLLNTTDNMIKMFVSSSGEMIMTISEETLQFWSIFKSEIKLPKTFDSLLQIR